jgi:hypothetical protein
MNKMYRLYRITRFERRFIGDFDTETSAERFLLDKASAPFEYEMVIVYLSNPVVL